MEEKVQRQLKNMHATCAGSWRDREKPTGGRAVLCCAVRPSRSLSAWLLWGREAPLRCGTPVAVRLRLTEGIVT